MEQMNERMDAPVAEEMHEPDVTAKELEENLSAEAGEQIACEGGQQSEDAAAQIREGIAELYADGWSTEELFAFSEDGRARQAIAEGHSVSRAACAYLRGLLEQGGRRRGVPTVQHPGMGEERDAARIENMTDEQFDAFSRRVHDAMMAGKRVRL